MDLMFFQLSEYPLKVRRNLLFIAMLVYLHVQVEPLSKLKIFNVTIPDRIIENGLAIGLVWFSLNYFYYLYAEFIEWKSNHVPRDGLTRGLKDQTLVSDITEMADNTYEISLTFTSTVSKNLFERNNPTEIDDSWGKQAEVLARQVQKQVHSDLSRIDVFQNAIGRYKFANRIRFWVLDLLVPIAALLVALFLLWYSTCITTNA